MNKFHHNFEVPRETKGEWNNDPSMTVPDMAMSLQEMAKRHVQGRPIPKSSRPMYYSGDDMPPPVHKMSEMDIEDMKRQNYDFIKEQENLLQEKRKARKKALQEQKDATKASQKSESEAEANKASDSASSSTVTT